MNLKEAVKSSNGYQAKYSTTVPVREVFRGETATKGFIDVFDLPITR